MAIEEEVKGESIRGEELLKLDRQLCFPLYAASRLVIQLYRPILNRYNLTYTQYLVMIVLWEEDRQSVKSLADKLLLDSPTLTPLLKKIEQHGYIKRERSPHDDRTVLNILTDKGLELKQEAKSIPEEMECKIPIDPDFAGKLKLELELLIGLLSCSPSESRRGLDSSMS